MNRHVKIEIWNENPLIDDLVGTYFIDLKDKDSNDQEVSNFKPRYLNFYGPPLVPKNTEQSQLMSMKGEYGTTYRGRLLCSFEVKCE